MLRLTLKQQRRRVEETLDRMLPTPEECLREQLTAIDRDEDYPNIRAGAFTKPGRVLYNKDGKELSFIRSSHLLFYVLILDALSKKATIAPGRYIGCPFCGTRMQTGIDWFDEDPLMIVSCPNATDDQRVCDWFDREERDKRAAVEEREEEEAQRRMQDWFEWKDRNKEENEL